MSESISPSGHDDFMDNPVIAALQAEIQASREREYLDDLAIFRADVFAALYKHDAISDQEGWAIFPLHTPEDEDGSTMSVGLNMDAVAVQVIPPLCSAPNAPPEIRLVTNEWERMADGIFCILTRDFTADEEGDTWYYTSLMDARMRSQQKDAQESSAQESDTMHVEAQKYQPLFSLGAHISVCDGYLVIGGSQTTPLNGVREKVTFTDGRTEQRTYAIGHYDNLEDKIYALKEMRAVFSRVRDRQPILCHDASEAAG